jgi:hypothetical protein
MGTTVLKPDATPAGSVHLYAQCMNGVPGGVTLLAINLDKSNPQTLTVSTHSQRYTLTAQSPEDTSVQLNGKELTVGPDDSIPVFNGTPAAAGRILLPPASITFLAAMQARNNACR